MFYGTSFAMGSIWPMGLCQDRYLYTITCLYRSLLVRNSTCQPCVPYIISVTTGLRV